MVGLWLLSGRPDRMQPTAVAAAAADGKRTQWSPVASHAAAAILGLGRVREGRAENGGGSSSSTEAIALFAFLLPVGRPQTAEEKVEKRRSSIAEGEAIHLGRAVGRRAVPTLFGGKAKEVRKE